MRPARGGRRRAGRSGECSQRDVANGDRDGRAPQFELIPKPALSRRSRAKTELGAGIITGRMPRLQPGLSRLSVAKTDQLGRRTIPKGLNHPARRWPMKLAYAGWRNKMATTLKG